MLLWYIRHGNLSYMKIKLYEPNDIVELKELFSACYEQDAPFRFLEQNSSIISINEEGKLIGFASQCRNPLHDKTISIEICVHPNFQRQGTGTKLYNALMERFPSNKADFSLDIRCQGDNEEGKAFLNSLGFEKYLECHSNTFLISELKRIETNEKIITLSEFYKSKGSAETIREFHTGRYDEDHEPFLPVTSNLEIRLDYYSDGDHDFGVVLLENGKVVGCSFSYLNFEEEIEEDCEDITCLHGYATGLTADIEAIRVQAMYSYQSMLLKQANHKNIYIEFDSIERVSEQMLNWIPRTGSPLLRFQKKVNLTDSH